MQLKFDIYKNGQRVEAYEVAGASPMGVESVPVAGEVKFANGQLVVSRAEEHATGVSLLWDMGALGEMVMETTRLKPMAGQPLILNVELARARVMKLMQKFEDWNLFDFPKAEQMAEELLGVRRGFSEVLGKINDGAAASVAADEVLQRAVGLSERVSSFHAEQLMIRRRGLPVSGRPTFGVGVQVGVKQAGYRELAKEVADFTVVRTSWRGFQPQEKAFITAEADEVLDHFAQMRMPVMAGALVDLSDASLPDWLYVWENDYEALRDMAYEYVQKVVSRYRKHVAGWVVCAGLHAETAFNLSYEQSVEFTRLLVAHVKSIAPGARVLVGVKQPFGQYLSRNQSATPPLLYAEMVAQAGIPFDAFSLELECGVPNGGRFVRDTFEMSCLLDKFAIMGKPVVISSMGCPSVGTPDPNDSSEGKFDPAAGGRWAGLGTDNEGSAGTGWNDKTQGLWLEEMTKLAISKPFVESIVWSDLADVNHLLPGGGMYDARLSPKSSAVAWKMLRQMMKKGN